ncbi:MAG: SHOCT domain-containing protein [Halobacteriota archaeon]
MAACKDCGKQLGAFEKKYHMMGGVICAACRQKPRVCSGCGGEIDRLKKHWVLKDGSVLCNACYEGRKKKEDDKKKMAGEVLESLAYVGGFAGITKRQVLNLRVGPKQVNVENIPLQEKNRKVFWTMPYNSITDMRIDTAEKITATRLLLTGVFAFALKKKQHYLLISFVDQNGFTHNPVFEGIHMNAVYQAIYERLAAARAEAQFVAQQTPTAGVPTIDVTAQTPTAGVPTIDVTEQIKKLGELRDQGLLTAQEFDSKKQELLARM